MMHAAIIFFSMRYAICIASLLARDDAPPCYSTALAISIKVDIRHAMRHADVIALLPHQPDSNTFRRRRELHFAVTLIVAVFTAA